MAPAGHNYKGSCQTRQQRPDLFMADGVIEQQEKPLACDMAAPKRCPRLQPGRDLLGADPKGYQQVGECFSRLNWPLPRRVSMQRQEDLTVGEPRGKLVCCVHSEGSLADPSHPADSMDSRDAGTAGSRIRHGSYELREFFLTTGEGCGITRQSSRGRSSGGAHKCRLFFGWFWAEMPSPRHCLKTDPGGTGEVQSISEQAGSIPPGGEIDASFQVAYRPGAEASGFSQFFLR